MLDTLGTLDATGPADGADLSARRSGADLSHNATIYAAQAARVAGYAQELAHRLEAIDEAIQSCAEALRMSQPNGAGMIDIRWWKPNGKSTSLLTPTFVRWNKQASRAPAGQPKLRPKKLIRVGPKSLADTEAGKVNRSRAVRALLLAKKAMEVRRKLLQRMDYAGQMLHMGGDEQSMLVQQIRDEADVLCVAAQRLATEANTI
jgi:hypothetical protein